MRAPAFDAAIDTAIGHSIDMPTTTSGGLGLAETTPAPLADEEALLRKLELADEFRQIGDAEGARDLLDEVLAQATGDLRARAQEMLDELR